MKKLIVMSGLIALMASGETLVKADQGAPGNQGPWPVTCVSGCGSGGSGGSGGSTFAFDGGYIGLVATQPCTRLIQTNDAGVGTSAQVVPATPATGRIWVQICNSILNFSSVQCICSTTRPTFAAGSPGDVLATGDCATYNIGPQDGGVPSCICNDAGVFLPSTECVP